MRTVKIQATCFSGNRLPYRTGMIVSALGLGALICGFVVRGALRLDGTAALELPRFLQGILARGGFSLSTDTEIPEPQLLFLGLGVTLLLVGAALLLNDWLHREAFHAATSRDA